MPKPLPRIRKQKAKRRAQKLGDSIDNGADSNALEILPSRDAEREERKRLLREDLQTQELEQSRMNPKKKKRLDKYIDNKLRKEESLDLIKKLAAQKIDTSLLQSSKRLGTVNESKRERLGRVLREKRAGLDVGEEEEILYDHKLHDHDLSDGTEEEDDNDENTFKESEVSNQAREITVDLNKDTAHVSFGAGLKRPLDVDDAGKPILQRRKRVKLTKAGWDVSLQSTAETQKDYSDWEGFDSESESADIERQNPTADRLSNGIVGEDSDQNSASSEIHDDDSDAMSAEDQEADSARDGNDTSLLQERLSAFKSWASQQRNAAIGFTPSTNINHFGGQSRLAKDTTDHKPNSLKVSLSATTIPEPNSAQNSVDIKPPSIETAVPVPRRDIFNVPVRRNSTVEESRLSLPVVAEEQAIMEAIHGHDTVILWGATGSGKTTQIPQFLFEAGYGDSKSPNPGMIGITQPRRVAAVSMSKRVAEELGDHRDKVSYQIRYDSTVHQSTAVKFMTDGVLIREISQDFTLSKYSAIVIDEAHERSVNTDILIGMLSRIVETRADLSHKTRKFKPLKLIIMSATLRTADLLENNALFRRKKPPVIQAEGRQYPVTMHFARKTQRDYVEETFQKVKRGHRKLPAGAILVFLTGQNEISTVAKKLKQEFASTDDSPTVDSGVRASITEAAIEDEDIVLDAFKPDREEEGSSDSEAEITGLDNDGEDEFNVSDDPTQVLKVHVLPLFSQLPTEQQMKVFQPPPEGSRLIVLATNVAETSLTIPNVRYVFDCGRAKEKRYDKSTGVQTFDIDWISKASANQRAGRAGRTGPGHCYRLYSSAVYERDFADHAVPEILRSPIEGLVLQLKTLGIPNVANFPFPTPPDKRSLTNAENLLEYLGAISGGKVTDLGTELVVYPLSPRFSRIIVMAIKYDVTAHALSLVAALTVADLFVPQNQLGITPLILQQDDNGTTMSSAEDSIYQEQRRQEYNSFHGYLARLDRSSDAMKLITTMSDFSLTSQNNSHGQYSRYLKVKALREAQQLRRQLLEIIRAHRLQAFSSSSSFDRTPSHKSISVLNQLVAAGFIDQVAIRADLSPTPPQTTRKPKHATDVPYITLFPSWGPDIQRTIAAQEGEKRKADAEVRLKSVYIHPTSVLAHTSPSRLPQFLIYSHLSRPSNSSAAEMPYSSEINAKLPKTRIHPLTPISAELLVALASGTPLLEDGKPIGKIEMLDRDDQGRERRRVACVPFLKPGKNGADLGWPLPPARILVQKRERGGGWVVENSGC